MHDAIGFYYFKLLKFDWYCQLSGSRSNSLNLCKLSGSFSYNLGMSLMWLSSPCTDTVWGCVELSVGCRNLASLHPHRHVVMQSHVPILFEVMWIICKSVGCGIDEIHCARHGPVVIQPTFYYICSLSFEFSKNFGIWTQDLLKTTQMLLTLGHWLANPCSQVCKSICRGLHKMISVMLAKFPSPIWSSH